MAFLWRHILGRQSQAFRLASASTVKSSCLGTPMRQQIEVYDTAPEKSWRCTCHSNLYAHVDATVFPPTIQGRTSVLQP